MKRAFTLIELIIVVAILGIIAAILVPVFTRSREPRHKGSPCQSNLKNIGFGFQMYIQDYHERLPRVTSGGDVYGWVDALHPYMKSRQHFICASDSNIVKSSSNPRAANYTSYWINARLSGLDYGKIKATALTVTSGDGNDGTDLSNARYAISSLFDAWRKDKTSPLYRHLEGANYAFADGHVKWYKPTKIQNNASVEKGHPTFNWK